MSDNTKSPVIGNIVWKMFERAFAMLVSFAVTMVLSRLLDPVSFGTVAIVNVFINIFNVFVTSGLGNALIQKEHADSLDFSTIFWVNVIFSTVIYTLLFISAPFIAGFFEQPLLCPLLRVQSVTILIYAVNAIQTAYISRNMMFQFYFYSTLTGKIASGMIGIIMAFCGMGTWSLVMQSVSLAAFETLVLWFKGGWRPKRKFSIERAKGLYSFSWKIMLSSLIVQVNDQLRNFIIGKKYTSSDIAYFDKGWLLPNTIVTNVLNALSAVMFPVLSKVQAVKVLVREKMRRWIGTYSFIMLPILLFIALNATDFVCILFSEKWLPSSPYLQLACVVYAVRCVEIPVREAIKSLGYANICLKMQVIKSIVAIITLIMVMGLGVYAIALNAAMCAVINAAISMFYGSKYIGYKMKMLVEDILITVIPCGIMAVVLLAVSCLNIPIYVRIILNVFAGFGSYALTAAVTKNQHFQYCLGMVKRLVKCS